MHAVMFPFPLHRSLIIYCLFLTLLFNVYVKNTFSHLITSLHMDLMDLFSSLFVLVLSWQFFVSFVT